MKLFLRVLPLAFLIACAEKPPVEEYTLARSAIQAAQAAGSNKYSPSLWFRAQEFYRRGENSFKGGIFDEARENFVEAKNFAERAENKSFYEKKKLGEDIR